jgi:hypothetical protein
MEQKSVNAGTLEFLKLYFPTDIEIIRPSGMLTVIKISPRANYAATAFNYVGANTAVKIVNSSPDFIRSVMAAPVKFMFRNGVNKKKFKEFAAAELAKVGELRRRSTAVKKLLPKLLKNCTYHIITDNVFSAIYGDIPCKLHIITGKNFFYQFTILE